MAAGAMCVVLPALSVLVAQVLGGRGAVLVLVAAAGGAVGVAWARSSRLALFEELIRLRIEGEQLRSDLQDAETDRSFRERLDQSLRASGSEAATIELALRAVSEILPEAEVSLLLNLPEERRVGWAVSLNAGSIQPAVPVPQTPGCLALSSLTTVTATSSQVVDACEHLRRGESDVSSVCIPLRLGDRTLGSVNAKGALGEEPSPASIRRAEWAVGRAAIRIAEQRMQRGPSLAGRTDPVTGLPGPSALRNQLKDLVRTLVPFCVTAVSVDNYEELRYGEGDEAAEIALGFVADALTSTLRPDDFVCRSGDSNFSIVLPGCNARQATAVIERARESLALLLAMESETVFTFSAGIAESHQARSLDELLELADGACGDAREAGGNRVALAFGADRI